MNKKFSWYDNAHFGSVGGGYELKYECQNIIWQSQFFAEVPNVIHGSLFNENFEKSMDWSCMLVVIPAQERFFLFSPSIVHIWG